MREYECAGNKLLTIAIEQRKHCSRIGAHKQFWAKGCRPSKATGVSLKPVLAIVGSFAVLNGTPATAADLHPIIEIETGYFLGASENGKWIKPD